MSKLEVNDRFIVNALRNCGYTNYTAIADIIDNSIEAEVQSSFVSIKLETEKSNDALKINSILICDDGVGMTMERLNEAVVLGSNTGKVHTDLGMYGAGLKTASFSIGQVMEVFTKVENDDFVNYARISLENAIAGIGEIEVERKECGPETNEYKYFVEKNKDPDGSEVDSGTVVRISHLDKLSCKDYYGFRGAIYKNVREIFNKYIEVDRYSFYVEGTKVRYLNLMYGGYAESIEMGNGEIDVGNLFDDGKPHKIKYVAYYLPMDGSGGKITEKDDCLTRNIPNQGFYIYRNYRLVGKSLRLGIIPQDHWFSGFRCELYIDGTCDSLFNSTFTKMIAEKDKDNLNQSLKDKLVEVIRPLANQARDRQKAERRVIPDTPEQQSANAKFYNEITEDLNKNKLLGSKIRRGKNDKSGNPHVQPENPRGPQKNPNPTKIRKEQWFGGFNLVNMGQCGEIFEVQTEKNLQYVNINKDHPFYEALYSTMDPDQKSILAKVFACSALARFQAGADIDPDIANIICQYHEELSREVGKALK